ncbi:hypothetical protein BX661DRAFT_177812 [Kickxella alabastrina]|uniref:uncharacterized protein n=1 Tax=Kickxella alabastrina TaxID=61397 RepID=UPI00221FECCB|nr:uncharacterized protein BX661DRAFT_177812 [Kickxella alabastrina]KAI7833921.1 hypothetical protein BX661DRAFT_177812 [Kickxella alabastrina]
MIAPLGSTVSASYQVMYRYTSDDAYINAIVSRIYNKLIISSLDAIGLYYANGIYTIVPQVIDTCPTYATPYVPESIVNGVNLPRILCSINTERVKAGRRPLAVHKALSDEAKEQVKLMDALGHYFKAPRISPLYWVAGQGNTDTDTMLDALSSKYYDDVTSSNYTIAGVAQLNGYWSFILGGLPYGITTRTVCPANLDQVTYVY